MTKERRTAMARVISDMIKDIEESKINDMKKLMSEYAIPCMTRSEFPLRQRWQCQLHYFPSLQAMLLYYPIFAAGNNKQL